jgi:hypothetical protein
LGNGRALFFVDASRQARDLELIWTAFPTYMTAMSTSGAGPFALTSQAFAGLSDHARLPSRFYARLSATASRLPGAAP